MEERDNDELTKEELIYGKDKELSEEDEAVIDSENWVTVSKGKIQLQEIDGLVYFQLMDDFEQRHKSMFKLGKASILAHTADWTFTDKDGAKLKIDMVNLLRNVNERDINLLQRIIEAKFQSLTVAQKKRLLDM